MMDTAKKRKKRFIKQLLFYIPFWALLTAGFGSVILTQLDRRDKYQTEQRRLTQELGAKIKTAEDLGDQIMYYNSDYYIEKIAREQLGLAYPDELIFSTY